MESQRTPRDSQIAGWNPSLSLAHHRGVDGEKLTQIGLGGESYSYNPTGPKRKLGLEYTQTQALDRQSLLNNKVKIARQRCIAANIAYSQQDWNFFTRYGMSIQDGKMIAHQSYISLQYNGLQKFDISLQGLYQYHSQKADKYNIKASINTQNSSRYVGSISIQFQDGKFVTAGALKIGI